MPSSPPILATLAAGLLTTGPDALWAHALRDGWQPDAPSTAETPGPYCHRCGASAGPGAVTVKGCSFCLHERFHWDRLIRLGPYADPLRPWLTAMKFHREWSWCSLFARELATRIAASPPPATTAAGPPAAASVAPPPASPSSTSQIPHPTSHILLCPVPMHWLRRCLRGYNQAQLLSDALSRHLRWPTTQILRRVRRTRPQTSVPISQRPANIRGSFALRPLDATGWDIWLVDDIKTTGSTLSVCARLLREAGARSVNIAVVAVADPHRI